MMRVHFPLAGKRAPRQRELDALFAAADGFELRQRSGAGRDGKVLIAGDGPALSALQEALRIREDETAGFHCMCHGDLGLALKKSDRTTVVLGLHHGIGIRHKPWDSDADLLAPRRFAQFLDDNGLSGTLAAFDGAEAAQRSHLAARDAWADAAPPSLRGFARSLSPNAPSPVQNALDGPIGILMQACQGDAHAAREALLRWSSASSSKWDVYPSYECVPIDMLARLEFDRAIAAHLESPAAADGQVLLGLARYIALRGLSIAGTESLHRGLNQATRARMLEIAAPYDAHDQLPRLLDPQRLQLHVPHGATLEHVFEEANHYDLCSDGQRFYGVDGARIVRFDPGERQPRLLCTVDRQLRVHLAASPRGLVVAEGPRLFVVSTDGAQRELLTLAQPPDALHAFAEHVLWVTNSDPTNPDGRTYSLQGRRFDQDPVRTLLPALPEPPYGIREYDGRWYALRRHKKRGLFGRIKQSIALFELPDQLPDRDATENGTPRLSFDSNDMLSVNTATTALPGPTDGQEKPGLWVAAEKKLFRVPRTGRPERVDLDVKTARLAQSAHGPLFMVDREDHLRIEMRTIWRATRYVLELPRLPWPSVLIARGDWLWISVGPAVLRTRI
jgi:hypothetical protein